MVLRATQLAMPEFEGCHWRTQPCAPQLSVPLEYPKHGDIANTRLVGCSSEREPLHLREQECCPGLPWGGSLCSLCRRSGRWYQPGTPPLPLTQQFMQVSDLVFFPLLSEGVGFHFLHSLCLCLRWTQLKAPLSGEGTRAGDEGDTPFPASISPETTQVSG